MNNVFQAFPGGPVVKSSFPMLGPRFNPWSGNEISRAATEKKKKRQKVEHILYSDAWFRYRQEPRGCGTLVGSLHPAPGVHLPSLTQLSVEVALFSELKTRWKQTRLTSPWNRTSSLTSSWIPGPKFLLYGFWNTYHLSSGAVLVSLCCADPKCNMVTSHVWEVLGGFGETETL